MLPGMINPLVVTASGGFVSDIHQPSGTTALLRVGFASNATAAGFDTNTISAAVGGTLTHSASGGLDDGGHATGWLMNTNRITYNSLNAVEASSTNQLTMICAVKTSQTTAAPNTFACGVPLFGDINAWSNFGLSNGKLHVSGVSATPAGAVLVADGDWHMVAFQQTSSTAFQLWVDGVKDNSQSHGGSGSETIQLIGDSLQYGSSVSPTALDAIQIYRPTLTDSQIEEIFLNAGY